MDKSFRSIPVVKEKSLKILLGSSSASSADVVAEIGIAVESEAQSLANVDFALLCGSSCQSKVENLQLPVEVGYDCDGSHWWMMWREGIGCLDGNCIISSF